MRERPGARGGSMNLSRRPAFRRRRQGATILPLLPLFHARLYMRGGAKREGVERGRGEEEKKDLSLFYLYLLPLLTTRPSSPDQRTFPNALRRRPPQSPISRQSGRIRSAKISDHVAICVDHRYFQRRSFTKYRREQLRAQTEFRAPVRIRGRALAPDVRPGCDRAPGLACRRQDLPGAPQGNVAHVFARITLCPGSFRGRTLT